MSIEVMSPGAMTLVQDAGRFGMQELGFSPGGAADTNSMMKANALVSNSPTEAVLEFTLSGGMLRFHESCVIALTGADMKPLINGKGCNPDRAIKIQKGDLLQMGFAQTGCRAYLAVAGGLKIAEVFGSRSTDRKCGIGGLEGRALRAGDKIGLREAKETLKGMEHRFLPQVQDKGRKAIPRPYKVRVIMGPQDDYFTSKGIETFLKSVYTIGSDSNRMACKLSGQPVEFKNSGDIISDGIAPGSIQVAGNGLPMIMMADRQTIGGYAKIATVISADIPVIAQCKPQDEIVFEKVSLRKAVFIYKKEYKKMRKLFRKMGGAF